MPTCWIIAGPNGSGKTTFALEHLPQVAARARFINADLIAAGLSPLATERELLDDFSHRVDACTCFMNDGASPRLVFEQHGDHRDVIQADDYRLLLQESTR